MVCGAFWGLILIFLFYMNAQYQIVWSIIISVTAVVQTKAGSTDGCRTPEGRDVSLEAIKPEDQSRNGGRHIQGRDIGTCLHLLFVLHLFLSFESGCGGGGGVVFLYTPAN